MGLKSFGGSSAVLAASLENLSFKQAASSRSWSFDPRITQVSNCESKNFLTTKDESASTLPATRNTLANLVELKVELETYMFQVSVESVATRAGAT